MVTQPRAAFVEGLRRVQQFQSSQPSQRKLSMPPIFVDSEPFLAAATIAVVLNLVGVRIGDHESVARAPPAENGVALGINRFDPPTAQSSRDGAGLPREAAAGSRGRAGPRTNFGP